MATKKKKNIKRKKKVQKDQQQFLDKDHTQLIAQGDNAFSQANHRNAIKYYQAALKRPKPQQEDEPILLKLFHTYCARAEELKGKNMPVEAAAMEKQALKCLPDITKLDRDAMVRVLKMCSAQEAFNVYRTYYEIHGSIPELERVLADLLISFRCWDLVRILSDKLPLKRDLEAVKKAVPLMDNAQWQQAMEAMKSLPRSSPFAHIRLFCRAMTAFYGEKDQDMLKAISMIPQDSVLCEITEVLKSAAKEKEPMTDFSQTADISPVAEEVTQCLWKGPFGIKKNLTSLLQLAKQHRYTTKTANCIKTMAQQLSPQDRDAAAGFILETLLHTGIPSEDSFYKMAKKVIGSRVQHLKCKSAAILMDSPLQSAQTYFSLLKHEFSSSQEQNMAKSMIICHMAGIFRRSPHLSLSMEPRELRELFGITSSDETTALLEFIAHGIHMDVRNRDLYQMACDMPMVMIGRSSKKRLESILLTMVDAWPDDPDPHLKLASLYHSKNAYRKAENTLKKAMELAPHDSRVMDQHVISLLIAADKNAKKRKFHLVWPDVDRAAGFDAPRCRLLLAEKQLFYELLEENQVDVMEIEKELNGFDLGDQLKLLLLMMQDITEKAGTFKQTLLKKIQKIFKQYLKGMEELTSFDVLNLLIPWPGEWKHNFLENRPMMIFPEKLSPLLGKLDDAHLFALIDKAIHYEGYEDIIQELNRRIKQKGGRKPSEKTVLRFYKTTMINLIQDSIYPSYDDYADIIEDIDPETEKQLKNAARQLSKKAFGPLQAALERFDFEILCPLPAPSLPFDFFNSLMDDEDEWDEDEWDEDEWDEDEWDEDEWDEDEWDEEEEAAFLDDLFSGRIPPFGGKKGGSKGIDPLAITPDMLLDPLVIKTMAPIIKQIIKSPGGRELSALFDDLLVEIEHIIDIEGLRNKPDHVLKKARKRLMKDVELKNRIDIINECYKSQAKSKLSREAKTLFIT